MYSKICAKFTMIFMITFAAHSFSMLPDEGGYLTQITNKVSYLGTGLYYGMAKTLVKNPFGVCLGLFHLIIEKDYVKDNPGKTAGIAASFLVPIIYNGFFDHVKIKNSLLQTIIDTPYDIGLALQKLCFDRDYIHDHPWRSSFVGANLIFTFARNYNELNKKDQDKTNSIDDDKY